MDLVNHLPDRLLFAIPKKGRLQQSCFDLLAGADVQFRRESRLDIALVKNLPIALIFLPAHDIPTFVGLGRVDLGITGRDQVAEYEALSASTGNELDKARRGAVEEVLDLGFGGCKLQVQTPERGTIHNPEELVGKNVVTSFEHLARAYFVDLEAKLEGKKTAMSNGDAPTERSQPPKKLQTNIIYASGSVEAACALGVADGVVDLVESGETMKAAGLKAISTVVSSTAVLIKSASPSSSSNANLVALIAARIRGFITAQRYVLCSYNVRRSSLSAASRITPGKRAPTVTSLDEEGWVAVEAMVQKERIATAMDELIAIGAEDVLVFNIQNSRGSE